MSPRVRFQDPQEEWKGGGFLVVERGIDVVAQFGSGTSSKEGSDDCRSPSAYLGNLRFEPRRGREMGESTEGWQESYFWFEKGLEW